MVKIRMKPLGLMWVHVSNSETNFSVLGLNPRGRITSVVGALIKKDCNSHPSLLEKIQLM